MYSIERFISSIRTPQHKRGLSTRKEFSQTAGLGTTGSSDGACGMSFDIVMNEIVIVVSESLHQWPLILAQAVQLPLARDQKMREAIEAVTIELLVVHRAPELLHYLILLLHLDHYHQEHQYMIRSEMPCYKDRILPLGIIPPTACQVMASLSQLPKHDVARRYCLRSLFIIQQETLNTTMAMMELKPAKTLPCSSWSCRESLADHLVGKTIVNKALRTLHRIERSASSHSRSFLCQRDFLKRSTAYEMKSRDQALEFCKREETCHTKMRHTLAQ